MDPRQVCRQYKTGRSGWCSRLKCSLSKRPQQAGEMSKQEAHEVQKRGSAKSYTWAEIISMHQDRLGPTCLAKSQQCDPCRKGQWCPWHQQGDDEEGDYSSLISFGEMHPKVLCPFLGSLEGDVNIGDQGLEHLLQESEREPGLLSLEERLR